MEELQKEAKAYEAELNQIRNNLKEQAVEIENKADKGRIVVGYCPSTQDDISLIKKHAQKYGFYPVMVLDCALDVNELTGFLKAAQGEDFEIMMTGSPLTESVLSTADRVRGYLKEYGFEDDSSFLLRGSDDVSENLSQLYKYQYEGLARFDASVEAGVTETGIPYLAYSFISNNNQLTGGIDQVIQNKSAMILVFDCRSIGSGRLTEADITATLDYVQKKTDSGSLIYSTVADALKEISDGTDLSDSRRQEYEEFASLQQERIDELEEKIHEIYSRWNEYE